MYTIRNTYKDRISIHILLLVGNGDIQRLILMNMHIDRDYLYGL